MTDKPSPEPDLRDLVKELTAAVGVLKVGVDSLTSAHRRKRFGDAVLAVVVVVGFMLIGAYYFIELPDRRQEVREQISNLACYAVRLRPPG